MPKRRRLDRGPALFALLLLTPPAVAAQDVRVGDPLEEYLRVLQVSGREVRGSFSVRPFLRLDDAMGLDASRDPWGLGKRLAAPRPFGGGGWLGGVSGQAGVVVNSTLPEGQNDGPVWSGKGLTAVLGFGGSVGLGALEISARPVLFVAQNAAFELAPAEGSEFAYPWHTELIGARIDLPQRFGDGAYARLDPGESSASIAVHGVRLGAGTGSLWWGPGVRSAIVLSNNAGGFPHLALGTKGPADLGVGVLEAQWIWGRLAHSDWWDESIAARDRYFTGAVVSFSPSFIPGMTLGATRVFVRVLPEGHLAASEYLRVLQGILKASRASADNPSGEDKHDQMGSVFARWVVDGLEVYGEWARNDHSWDFRDLMAQLGHSEGYTVGVRRVVELGGGRLLSLLGEATHLERSGTGQVRAAPTFYAHHLVRQGYTQRGQVLGAAIGPGGNVQYVGADLYHAGGRVGAFVQRRVYDNDAYYTRVDSTVAAANHASVDAGASALFFTRGLEVDVGLMVSKHFNRYFVRYNDVWNASARIHGRWRWR
jgi:hypothetical protein